MVDRPGKDNKDVNASPTVDPTDLPETASATGVSIKPDSSGATAEPIIVNVEPLAGLTYVSDEGNFRLTYPENAELYENEVPSVDGVLMPVENTIAIRGREGYVLVITRFDLKAGSSITDFVEAQSQCVAITPITGQAYIISGQEFLFFGDTPCGPSGASFFYAIRDGKGYLFQVITQYRYATVQELIEPILTSFQVLGSAEAAESTNIIAHASNGRVHGDFNRWHAHRSKWLPVSNGQRLRGRSLSLVTT